jgi:RNA polymerase primary sigma factor
MLSGLITDQVDQFIDIKKIEIFKNKSSPEKLLPFQLISASPTAFSSDKTGEEITSCNTFLNSTACEINKISQKEEDELGAPCIPVSSTKLNGLAVIYLREVRSLSTSWHAIELQVRKNLEECEEKIAQAVLSVPLTIREVISIGEKLQTDKISLAEFSNVTLDKTAQFTVDFHRNKVLTLIGQIRHVEKQKGFIYKQLVCDRISKQEKKTLQKKVDCYAKQQLELLQQIDLNKTFISTVVLKLKRYLKRLQKKQEGTSHTGCKTKYIGGKSNFKTKNLNQILTIVEEEESKIQEARNQLVKTHLGLVVGLAKRYTNRGLDFLDLVQEGNIGLIKAASKFDATTKYKFSSHAAWWIKQGITRAIVNQGKTIRIPVYLNEIVQRVTRVSNQMLRETGRKSLPEEVEKILGFSPDQFQHLYDMQKLVSLDKPASKEGNKCLKDLIEDKKFIFPGDIIDNRSLHTTIVKIMEILTPQEKKVLSLRFGIGDAIDHTLEKVGQDLSLTRQRIKQIEDKALGKLKKYCKRKGLSLFLEA